MQRRDLFAARRFGELEGEAGDALAGPAGDEPQGMGRILVGHPLAVAGVQVAIGQETLGTFAHEDEVDIGAERLPAGTGLDEPHVCEERQFAAQGAHRRGAGDTRGIDGEQQGGVGIANPVEGFGGHRRAGGAEALLAERQDAAVRGETALPAEAFQRPRPEIREHGADAVPLQQGDTQGLFARHAPIPPRSSVA